MGWELRHWKFLLLLWRKRPPKYSPFQMRGMCQRVLHQKTEVLHSQRSAETIGIDDVNWWTIRGMPRNLWRIHNKSSIIWFFSGFVCFRIFLFWHWICADKDILTDEDTSGSQSTKPLENRFMRWRWMWAIHKRVAFVDIFESSNSQWLEKSAHL